MSLCKAFGYIKKDHLLNKSVNILMPTIYSQCHKKFLEQGMHKPPDLLNQRERFVFGKNANGYIFPLQLMIKNVPGFLSGRQFFATLKPDKQSANRQISYLLVDKQKVIKDITTSCISMLGINLDML